jgi:hypothetical protein
VLRVEKYHGAAEYNPVRRSADLLGTPLIYIQPELRGGSLRSRPPQMRPPLHKLIHHVPDINFAFAFHIHFPT